MAVNGVDRKMRRIKSSKRIADQIENALPRTFKKVLDSQQLKNR
jgi:hypothetical protein